MDRRPIFCNVEPAMADALDRAAAKERRSRSAQVARYIERGLIADGYLPVEPVVEQPEPV